MFSFPFTEWSGLGNYNGPTVSRSATGGGSSSPSSVTFNPAPTSGKVIILMIETDGDILTVPSGFTEIQSNGGTLTQCLYKVCGGSEPFSYSVDWDDAGPTGISLAAIEISGANGTPIDVSNAADSTLISPSVTTTSTNRLICTAGGASSTGTMSAPPFDYTMVRRSGNGTMSAIAYRGQIQTGPTGTLTWTTGTADRLFTFAIK